MAQNTHPITSTLQMLNVPNISSTPQLISIAGNQCDISQDYCKKSFHIMSYLFHQIIYSAFTNISSKLKTTFLNCFNRPIPRRPSRDEDTVPLAGTVAERSLNSADDVPIVSLNSGTFTISSCTVPLCPHTFCVSTGNAVSFHLPYQV